MIPKVGVYRYIACVLFVIGFLYAGLAPAQSSPNDELGKRAQELQDQLKLVQQAQSLQADLQALNDLSVRTSQTAGFTSALQAEIKAKQAALNTLLQQLKITASNSSPQAPQTPQTGDQPKAPTPPATTAKVDPPVAPKITTVNPASKTGTDSSRNTLTTQSVSQADSNGGAKATTDSSAPAPNKTKTATETAAKNDSNCSTGQIDNTSDGLKASDISVFAINPTATPTPTPTTPGKEETTDAFTVSGKIWPIPTKKILRLCINDVEIGKPDAVGEQTRIPVDNTGAFTFKLSKPLISGQKVVVQQVTSADNATSETYGIPSAEKIVGKDVQCSTGKAATGQALSAPVLRRGGSESGTQSANGSSQEKSVTGALPNLGADSYVRVCVDDKVVSGLSVKKSDDGNFIAVLDNSLNPGQKVTVQQVVQAKQATSATAQDSQAETYGPLSNTVVAGGHSNAFDFGRSRMYLSLGAVLSQDQNQFSKSSVYLDFDTDSTWFMRDFKGNMGITGWKKNVAPKQFNTSFDARLTSLPVTSCNQAANPAAGCAPSSDSSFDTFITTSKAAVVSASVYLPYYFAWSSWRWPVSDTATEKMHRYALFFAPLGKAGFQTLLNPTQSTPTSTPASSTATTSTTTVVNNQTYFHFYAPGMRFGLFKFHDEQGTSMAPDNLMYLDVAYGKYENFAEVAPGTQDIFHPNRLAMEGRFKIPKLPFIIGFDSNTRYGSPQGDLRFLFGTMIDVGCLVQKISGSSSNPVVSGCDTSTPAASTATPASTGSSGGK